ncbi:MAG: hypothetical protein Q7K34_00875 [archaeon]|nr:hypothetical protein [archaeon]
MEKEIKCRLCQGRAELQFEEVKLSDGRITIRDPPYYKCLKCRREFTTSEQMTELSGQISSKNGKKPE